jgi:hypothetical protein
MRNDYRNFGARSHRALPGVILRPVLRLVVRIRFFVGDRKGRPYAGNEKTAAREGGGGGLGD